MSEEIGIDPEGEAPRLDEYFRQATRSAADDLAKRTDVLGRLQQIKDLVRAEQSATEQTTVAPFARRRGGAGSVTILVAPTGPAAEASETSRVPSAQAEPVTLRRIMASLDRLEIRYLTD